MCKKIIVLDPDTTTYNDTGLTCGTAYDYRLRAYRTGDSFYSDYSNTNSSPSGACTAQTAGEYDDTHADLVYSGTWTSESDAGAYNGTRTYSQIEGSKLTFTSDTSCFSLLYTGMAGGAEVDVYVDGDLLDTIDQDSGGLNYQEAWGYCGLESGQTHVLVFRQSDGALMDVDALLVDNYPISDDDNQLISYGIGWISYLGNGPYDNSIHYSEMVGSQAEVTFSGTSVGLFYTTSSNRGVLQIQIDGVTVAYLNQYSLETQYQQYWTANGLRDGTHKITFTHTSGTLVDIDGIWVEELLPAAF